MTRYLDTLGRRNVLVNVSGRQLLSTDVGKMLQFLYEPLYFELDVPMYKTHCLVTTISRYMSHVGISHNSSLYPMFLMP